MILCLLPLAVLQGIESSPFLATHPKNGTRRCIPPFPRARASNTSVYWSSCDANSVSVLTWTTGIALTRAHQFTGLKPREIERLPCWHRLAFCRLKETGVKTNTFCRKIKSATFRNLHLKLLVSWRIPRRLIAHPTKPLTHTSPSIAGHRRTGDRL